MNPRALLAPLTPLYRLGVALRERRLATGREPIRRLRLPVLSIGNLSTGGSGKTPLVIALAQALTARGIAVDVLSRGYGRSSPGAARVDPKGSDDDFGDEPLLIARSAGVPVYVAPQRYDAGLLAETNVAQSEMGAPSHETLDDHLALKGHDFSRAARNPQNEGALAPEGSWTRQSLHLLDDAFQHRQLHRDIDILLLGRSDLTDRLLPAGNLREPLSAMRRAHVLALPAGDPALESDLRARGWQGPVWRIRRRMEIPALAGPVLAFCGIARPAQFFAGLEAAGVRIALRRAFPDHHRYTQSDLDRLANQARAAGVTTLLTTEKDDVRLERLHSSIPIRAAQLVTELADEAGALDWLIGRLAQLSRSTTQI